MSENLETSLNAMLSKMRARVDDDYLSEPQEQPAEPDQFDAEIEQAIKESENGTDTTSRWLSYPKLPTDSGMLDPTVH